MTIVISFIGLVLKQFQIIKQFFMNTENLNIKISNFKLNVFRNLLEESLIVNNQLMLEFSSSMIKSCTFSSTKSFIKLWTIPLDTLIQQDSNELELTSKLIKHNFPTFNFYILKGDLFNKYLSVHNSDTVDLEFVLQKTKDNKYQAESILISSKDNMSSGLKTSFILTTEELISNKIDDYADVISECTPSKSMFEFILSNKQIQEIKRLIKNLHKSLPDNQSFLTFTIDIDNSKIVVNDKVFTIDFPLLLNQDKKIDVTNMTFNILKSDFVMTGNHNFSIYTDNKEQKVILGTNFAGSIIWCLSSKIREDSISIDNSIMDSTLDQFELNEYLS